MLSQTELCLCSFSVIYELLLLPDMPYADLMYGTYFNMSYWPYMLPASRMNLLTVSEYTTCHACCTYSY